MNQVPLVLGVGSVAENTFCFTWLARVKTAYDRPVALVAPSFHLFEQFLSEKVTWARCIILP